MIAGDMALKEQNTDSPLWPLWNRLCNCLKFLCTLTAVVFLFPSFFGLFFVCLFSVSSASAPEPHGEA